MHAIQAAASRRSGPTSCGSSGRQHARTSRAVARGCERGSGSTRPRRRQARRAAPRPASLHLSEHACRRATKVDVHLLIWSCGPACPGRPPRPVSRGSALPAGLASPRALARSCRASVPCVSLKHIVSSAFVSAADVAVASQGPARRAPCVLLHGARVAVARAQQPAQRRRLPGPPAVATFDAARAGARGARPARSRRARRLDQVPRQGRRRRRGGRRRCGASARE